MQVMGIIPKKERKKKLELSFLPDGNGIHGLDPFKTPNGYLTDDKSNSHHFSASKMFPELAGKLSLDNQKTCDPPPSDLPSKPTAKPSSRTLNSASNLSSKRVRKPSRKHLSILKKKQLGLLTDEEAKASLTALGCRTYGQYAATKMAESELLTPLIDSSEDESGPLPMWIAHGMRTPCSPLSSSHTTNLTTESSE